MGSKQYKSDEFLGSAEGHWPVLGRPRFCLSHRISDRAGQADIVDQPAIDGKEVPME